MRVMNHKKWLICLVGLLIAISPLAGAGLARAQQPNQVGLVVQHGDGRLITRCVKFDESQISGYEMLTRSGLEVVANFDWGMGAAICAIDGEGCPANNCFCQCQGSPCIYWAYHHLVDGQWVYSNLGASNYNVRHGDVEGWAWGAGAMEGGGAQPPVIPFDQICVPPATETPVPTDTPTPAPPTATPIPATATVTPPLDTATPSPPEVWFRLDQNPVPAGACTTVRWDTSRAPAVYLDGESVAPNGQQEVCPTVPQTYRLRVVGADETETTYELVLGVTDVTLSPPASATLAPTVAAPSPTVHAVSASLSSSPSPSPTMRTEPQDEAASLTSTPTSPTTTRATPLPTQAAPSPTSARVAQAEPAPIATDLPAASDDDSSSFVPLGYVAFALVVAALLGWLVVAIRRRR